MRRSAFSILTAVAIVTMGTLAAQAAPVNATGHWSTKLTDGADLHTGVISFTQVGSTVVGKSSNTTINGTMVSDTKCNAKWNGPKGAGWLTIYFSADGKSFQGTWGYNGRKANGSFVGKRITGSM